MTGRRSILGLSLLGALAFCAFGAQSASAWSAAIGTTAYECSKSAAKLDFADAHCDTSAGSGAWGHKSIPAGTSVPIETSNEATKSATTQAEPVVLKGSLLGAAVKITCSTVFPDAETPSFVKNVAEGDFEGTSAVKFAGCVLEGNGAPNCHVVEPITLATLFHAVEQKIGTKQEMAIEFTPDPSTSTTFTTIKFAESGCLLKEASLEGKLRGTGSGAAANGATLKFLPADEELTFGGNVATLEGTFTNKVSSTGNALVTTTTSPPAWSTATNTTAFECSSSATTLDYSDAHCDNAVSSGGAFGHKSITAGTSVEIETSNTATKNNTAEAEAAVLTGSLLGLTVKITCHKVEPDTEVRSFVKNIAVGDFEGTSAITSSQCVLEGNGAPNCEVVEPITLATLFHAVERTTVGGREMAIEFNPDPSTGTTFIVLHFAGTGCLLTEGAVKGSARGTGSGAGNNGATLKFQPADEELTFGGNAATFEGTFTTKVKSTGNALVTTTTP